MLNVERLYRSGFVRQDFGELAPNLLILRRITRPAKLGTIVMAGDDPRFESLVFSVEAMGPTAASKNPLSVGVDDVVAIRNALAEPIQPDRMLVLVDVRYVFSVVERADVRRRREASEAHAEASAKAQIEAERAALVARNSASL